MKQETVDKFIGLTIAFDAFTDSINGNDCSGDLEFLESCTAFFDAMQAFRARNNIDRGVK